MARLSLPHTLDLYTPGVGGESPTLAKANVPGYFELLKPGGRIQLQDVSKSQMAVLWLDISVKALAADGMQVYWRDRGTWWTMRGAPEIFEAAGQEHIEVVVAANTVDGFFSAATGSVPLAIQIGSASSVTAVKVEVSTAPDFATLAVNANSADDQTGWYYANGNVWSPIPAGGLPPLSTQTVVYLATGLLPEQAYYVRWTPYAGATALGALLGVVRT
ncbi:MAG TPA: hypothetical protein VFB38_19530 [Chthonomonadaceae bacterium]|nr:hypothetical protein [Chthonomonadaceae bacterium]